MDKRERMLRQARKHIKAKDYDQARRILKKVNHPTARKWLAKLDEIAPERKANRWRRGCLIVALVALVACVGLVGLSQALVALDVLPDVTEVAQTRVALATLTTWTPTATATSTATITNTPLPTLTSTPVTPTATDIVILDINGYSYMVTYDETDLEMAQGTELRSCPLPSCRVVQTVMDGHATKLGEVEGGEWFAVLDDGVEGFWLVATPAPNAPVSTIAPISTPVPIRPTRQRASCPYTSPTCGDMSSCNQAYACLRDGNRNLDRDGDGVPCESICN